MRVFWDVDTQVDFMSSDGKLYVPGAETIAANLERLTNYAHATGITIIASADEHVMTHEEISETPDFQDTFPPHCMRGTPGQRRIAETFLRDPLVIAPDEPLPDLAGHQGDILFLKHWFDVFTNPHVSAVVNALDVSDIVLYGVALDVCDRYAVEGLRKFHPEIAITVVSDAVKALDANVGDALLRQWHNDGIVLTPTEQVVDDR
jgi:nicotinamidase/pyrazinamidase